MLAALNKAPFVFPLHLCDLKHLTLRTVFLLVISSAHRASEIHAISLDTRVRHAAGTTLFTDERFSS